MENFNLSLLHVIEQHQAWGPFIIGLLAFGESLAIVSLLIPATFVMLALGGLIGLGGLDLMPFCIGASIGAFLGDVVSYEIGRHYGPRVLKLWPLKNYPDLFKQAQAFFRRWGLLGIVGGRFIGPLRAFIPLSAGIAHMPRGPFLLVDFLSAPLWAVVLLAPGAIGLAALG
ncbi:MAG: DedA family protein [Pseudomonadota bacterium]